jgi:hypothetical protein
MTRDSTHRSYSNVHGKLLAAIFKGTSPFLAIVAAKVISQEGGSPVKTPSIHADEQPDGLQVEKLAEVTVNCAKQPSCVTIKYIRTVPIEEPSLTFFSVAST